MATIGTDQESLPQLFYEAIQQVMQANITPMLALWSEHDDVTYVDPAGHYYHGHDSLVAYWERAVQLNSQAPGRVSVTADLLMMHRSEGVLCTVMAEHIQIRQHAEAGVIGLVQPGEHLLEHVAMDGGIVGHSRA